MGAVEDLFESGDLSGLPGAPFSAETTKAAGETIRRLCGWHIAPEVTEVLTLDSDGSRVLMLPSLKVGDVTLVRDLSGAEPRVLTGWRWSADGMLERNGGYWPVGFRTLEVTLTHGFESCPVELFPVGADFSRRRVAQESIGGRSVTFVSSVDGRLDDTLSHFVVPGRP